MIVKFAIRDISVSIKGLIVKKGLTVVYLNSRLFTIFH
jgi:hypothetical protein